MNLFGWPHHPHSRLSVIVISNEIRLRAGLSPSIQSRMGEQKVLFHRYDPRQLIEILKAKLGGQLWFLLEEKHVLNAMTKFFDNSCDVRRLVQVTEMALRYSEIDAKDRELPFVDVNFLHWKQAIQDVFSSRSVQVLSAMQMLEVVVILAAWNE
jgi:Cdc6-like AAA superfamily ATPase